MVFVLAAVSIAACAKWGAWKRWREFYPTILYLIIGNLAYNFVFHEYMLWEYDCLVGHTYTGLVIMFLVYPSAIILYLTHFPEGFIKSMLYMLACTALGTGLEGTALLTEGIKYANGWTLIHSAVMFAGLFALLRLHYKHPLLAWPLSLACGVAVSLLFGLPPPP